MHHPDILIYAQGGNLMAVPFDPQQLTVTGAAVPVVEGVLQSTIQWSRPVQPFCYGIAGIRSGGVESAQRTLVWVSRNGTEQPLAAPAHAYLNPRLSPDGQRVAVTIEEAGGSNLAVRSRSGDVDPVYV